MGVLSGVRDAHAGTARNYTLDVCASCGSTKMREQLSENELRRIYPDDYYSYVTSDPRRSLARLVLGALYHRHRYIPCFTSLLEVGCGRGEFLAKIKNKGNVLGLERSSSASKAAAALGIEVVVGDVENAATFAPASFDCIYSNHAFEHLADPEAALASMERWIKEEGELFIGIPNIKGVVARLFGRNWYYIGPPLHVTNSTPKGMTSILARHGFEIEKIEYNSDPLSIAMSVYFSLSGRADNVGAVAKIAIGLASIVLYPLSKLLDAIHCGDCIEVHARKRRPQAPV